MLTGITVGFISSLALIGLWRCYAKPKAFGAQKFDHIKYDILPDGTLGPGNNRNLENP